MSNILISCFDENERHLCNTVVEAIPRIGETISLIPSRIENANVRFYTVVNVVHGFHCEQKRDIELRERKLPTSMKCGIRVSLILRLDVGQNRE